MLLGAASGAVAPLSLAPFRSDSVFPERDNCFLFEFEPFMNSEAQLGGTFRGLILRIVAACISLKGTFLSTGWGPETFFELRTVAFLHHKAGNSCKPHSPFCNRSKLPGQLHMRPATTKHAFQQPQHGQHVNEAETCMPQPSEGVT